MPVIGDISSASTTQPSTTSQDKVSVQEAGQLKKNGYNIIVSVTSVAEIEKEVSTRDESHDSLLGE